MNITRITTGDGRAMKIEGGDSRAVANVIAKSFGGKVENKGKQSTVPADPSYGNGVDEELPMPTMNFEQPDEARQVQGEGLPLPVMNFDSPPAKIQQNKKQADDEGLSLPSMF